MGNTYKLFTKMNIIITAKMGNGTIQAKLEPLSRISTIENIYFLRKSKGPEIPKVEYIILPSICKISLFNLMLTPMYLVKYTIKYNASYILSYHIIPYAFFAIIGSLLTNKPYFICQTGLYVQRQSEKKLLWFFLKRIIFKSKALCVPGTNSLEFWKRKGIPISKICINHSTIDTDKFPLESFSKRSYDFIYSGRIGTEKRIDILLKAFALLCSNHPQAKLLIVGEGPLLEEMKKLSQQLCINNNVFFAGYHENILPWLQKSKFIVLTSDSEGLPCAIMEGMSTGLIPITTKVGNLPDIVINEKTGFLFEPGDVPNLTNHMSHLLVANPNEIEHLRQNSRRIIVEQHSHITSIENWKVLFEI